MKKYWRFLLSFFLLYLSCIILENTKQLSEKEYYDVMLSASAKTEAAFQALKAEKLRRGFTISSLDDPNQTGMIGEPYSEITTTLGNLEAKRSTTNPNISAMIVDMLVQCKVKAGDNAAVNLSSSFPCVNIATLCALDAMDVKAIVINSVGASTYGANLPEFTYMDMEHFLSENGYIKNHTTYFSLGGIGDQGKEMPEEIKRAITTRLKSYGLTFLSYDDIDENTNARAALYDKQGKPACFINAGGNLLSFGGGSEMVSSKNGVILPGNTVKGNHGLIPLYLRENVPVIHLLNMKILLPAYGLPIDPMPLPIVGQGGVYQTFKYNIHLAFLLFSANAAWLCHAAKRFPHRKYPL